MRTVRPLLVVEVVVVGVAVVEGGDPPGAPGVVLKATGVPGTGEEKNKKNNNSPTTIGTLCSVS